MLLKQWGEHECGFRGPFLLLEEQTSGTYGTFKFYYITFCLFDLFVLFNVA